MIKSPNYLDQSTLMFPAHSFIARHLFMHFFLHVFFLLFRNDRRSPYRGKVVSIQTVGSVGTK